MFRFRRKHKEESDSNEAAEAFKKVMKICLGCGEEILLVHETFFDPDLFHNFHRKYAASFHAARSLYDPFWKKYDSVTRALPFATKSPHFGPAIDEFAAETRELIGTVMRESAVELPESWTEFMPRDPNARRLEWVDGVLDWADE